VEKKWYQSKKFFMALITALLVVLNEGLGLNIPADAVMTLATVAAGYIFVEGGLDLHRERSKNKAPVPIQDPMIREAVESLVNRYYDYDAAADYGIEVVAKEITHSVLKDLGDLLDPQLHEKILDDGEIKSEILRQVFKRYNQDTSMKEGADLVLSQRK
jgi:hypothetical protein